MKQSQIIHITFLFLLATIIGFKGNLQAQKQHRVDIYQVSKEGIGLSIGHMDLEDTPEGLKISPHLEGLTPGNHGFHVHQNPNCNPLEKDGQKVAAGAAGGHFDPKETNDHLGPYGHGHLGDLPRLTVDTKGMASTPVIAPHLTLKEIQGRSFMIHAGGDNYSDQPEPLGGGGARVACGVISTNK